MIVRRCGLVVLIVLILIANDCISATSIETNETASTLPMTSTPAAATAAPRISSLSLHTVKRLQDENTRLRAEIAVLKERIDRTLDKLHKSRSNNQTSSEHANADSSVQPNTPAEPSVSSPTASASASMSTPPVLQRELTPEDDDWVPPENWTASVGGQQTPPQQQEQQQAPASAPESLPDVPESLAHPQPIPDTTDATIRREFIRGEMLYAYHAYMAYAWGHDTVKPVTRSYSDSYNMYLTMIDAMDTLYIMNATEEYNQSLHYLIEHLQFHTQIDVNVFEVTIRVLGSLLSLYALTNNHFYKIKAIELADAMLPAFNTPTGLPFGTISFTTGIAHNPQWSQGASSIAEVGSIQLEWQYLTRITNNTIYANTVNKIMCILLSNNVTLYPQFINVYTGALIPGVITLGARVDSLYEYMIKQHILSGQVNHTLMSAEMYHASIDAIHAQLLTKNGTPSSSPTLTQTSNTTNETVDAAEQQTSSSSPSSSSVEHSYICELSNGNRLGKVDHLTCFLPGLLSLVNYLNLNNTNENKFSQQMSIDLMSMCVDMYNTATGIAPEIIQFNPNMSVDMNAAHSLLRPETVESLFYLWRQTHNQTYRDWGWKIMTAFTKYARVPGGGYSNLKDVRRNDLNISQYYDNNTTSESLSSPPEWSNWADETESFFYSETLKYLYLLFSDDELIPLTDWVFNTEAHPLPIDTQPTDHSPQCVIPPPPPPPPTPAPPQPTPQPTTDAPGQLTPVEPTARIIPLGLPPGFENVQLPFHLVQNPNGQLLIVSKPEFLQQQQQQAQQQLQHLLQQQVKQHQQQIQQQQQNQEPQQHNQPQHDSTISVSSSSSSETADDSTVIVDTTEDSGDDHCDVREYKVTFLSDEERSAEESPCIKQCFDVCEERCAAEENVNATAVDAQEDADTSSDEMGLRPSHDDVTEVEEPPPEPHSQPQAHASDIEITATVNSDGTTSAQATTAET